MNMRSRLAVSVLSFALLSCSSTPMTGPASSRIKFEQITEADLGTFFEIKIDTATTELKMLSALSTRGEVRNFETLNTHVTRLGRTLSMAVNGGMFHRNMDPVGLYVENSVQYVPLNLDDRPGNFFLKPNGFFALTPEGPVVGVSEDWPKIKGATFATQSGPMLLIGGQMHPKFDENAPNKNIRSGVCVTDNRYVYLVTSISQVRFADLAKYFLRRGCKDALYLDGHISQTFPPVASPLPPQNFGTFIYAD